MNKGTIRPVPLLVALAAAAAVTLAGCSSSPDEGTAAPSPAAGAPAAGGARGPGRTPTAQQAKPITASPASAP